MYLSKFSPHFPPIFPPWRLVICLKLAIVITTYKLYIISMPLSGKQIIKLLFKEGWQLDRVNGSHHILIKGSKSVTVPVHGNKSLGKGLESKILKQTGLKK